MNVQPQTRELSTKLTALEARLALHQKNLDDLDVKLETLEKRDQILTEALSLCQKAIGDKSAVNAHIERAITYMLQAVFPDKDMVYVLSPVMKADKVTVGGYKHMIEEHGQQLKPTSNGVKDVISMGYRQLALLFSPNLTPFQFYDEPCPHLNSSRIPGVIEFTKNIQEQRNFKFAFITHANLTDTQDVTKYRVSKSGDTSKITKQ